MTVTVTPPPRHIFNVNYQVTPDSSSPGATAGDVSASGSIFILGLHENRNDPSEEFTDDIIAVDDALIEETEDFEVTNLTNTMGNADGIHLFHPADGEFSIVDNEWRWIDTPTVVLPYDPGVTTNFADGWYGWLFQDYMKTNFTVETKSNDGAQPSANGVYAKIHSFYDRLTGAFPLGSARDAKSLDRTYERYFTCNPETGDITDFLDPATGQEPPHYSGDGTQDGILSIVLQADDAAEVDNDGDTVHTVTVNNIVADAAVGGTLSVGLNIPPIVEPLITFQTTESWGVRAGPFGPQDITLTCRKGSS
jgi:hypothetical protein